MEGTLEADQPGQVIENIDLTGSIEITADDVVIRNVHISTGALWAIRAFEASGAVIENVEIDCQGNPDNDAGINVASQSADKPSVVRAVDIHGCVDGLKMGSFSELDVSFVHDLTVIEDVTHNDGVQVLSGESIIIRGNTCLADTRWTSCFLVSADTGDTDNVLVEANLITAVPGSQPNVGLYLIEDNGNSLTGSVVRGNRWGYRNWNIVTVRQVDAEWTDNLYIDDGTPVE